MKTVRLFATAAVGLAVITSAAQAQTDIHTVTFTVGAVSTITLGADPATLSVTPGSFVTQNTTYSVTTNEANRKITAQLSAVMGNGLTLAVSLTPPTGAGAALGFVNVSDVSATNVVTAIAPVTQAGIAMQYRLTATATATPITTPATRTVTYTILAGP